MTAIRRLLADLGRAETRRDALRRVRRLAASRHRHAERSATIRRAQLRVAQAALADAIAAGEPLEAAVCRCVAALAAVREWDAAWAVAEGVGRLPGGARASAMGHAVLLHRRRTPRRAWELISGIDDETLAREIPLEAVDAAFAVGNADTARRALAIAVPDARMDDRTLVDLAGRCLAFGRRERAAELLAELRRRPAVDLDDHRRRSRLLIERWLGRRSTPIPAGSVPFALIDYESPDHARTSGNLGDFVQTLALLGNLARLSDVSFTGDDGLGELATELQTRVRPELRVEGAGGSMHLVAVDRDFSSGAHVPPGTWMVAFGWHMLPLYEARCDFPYHPGIRPLFVSFHLNRLELLTDEAREYLRRYGPVGCRDWSTVFLLLGAGIDAFFTGCLTTTIDAVYPEREAVYSGGGAVGVIDLPLHAAGVDAAVARRYTHQSEALRLASLADNLRTADGVLAAYQRDLDRAVTGRLHAYLPLTSLGVEVELRNANPGDMRFAGLTGLRPGDERLAEMQRGIRDLVAAAIGAVLSGAGEDDVYAQWRELARPLVAEARTRFQAPVVDPPPTFDVVAAATAIRSEGVRMGPHAGVDQATVTDVAVCVDGDRLFRAGVLVESLVATASGDVRLWVLDRGLTDASRAWLGSAFPAVPMTFLRRDGLPRAVAGRSVARLLLPVLLDRVDRVVCLDADGLALDDIGILARVDLGGRPLAARDAATSEAAAWRRAAARLPVTDAIELERRFAQVHGTGGAAIDAGVLVLDLERMRRDDAIGATMPLVERFGLTDEDCLLAWVGPDRAVLEPRWNAVPALDGVRDPGFVRWAGVGKPWEPRLTFGQDRWREHAAGLRSRAGPPPASDAATAAAVAGVASIPAGAHVVRADGEAELERVLAGRP